MNRSIVCRCALGGLLVLDLAHAGQSDRFALRHTDIQTNQRSDNQRFSVRATGSLRPMPDEQARFQLKAALVDCAVAESLFANGFESSTP